ncbi:DNA/RNA nuclease SfsA [Hydrogenobaculum acidophilum]
MQFELKECIVLERLNRFVAKVLIDNKETLVHIRNTGRLPELLQRGVKGLLEKKEGGKYQWHLKAVNKNGYWVYIDSLLAPKLFLDFAKKEGLFDIKSLKLEPKYGNSHKFDILINNKIVIETKSVNLVREDIAMFPDAPSERGTKHVELLKNIYKTKEYKPMIVFVVQRPDAKVFKPNEETDPAFSKALKEAKDIGIDILCVDCYTSENEIFIKGEIPKAF